MPSAITCSLSQLICCSDFSRTGGVLSHLNSLTHRFPRFPPRNLCSLVTLAVCSFVFAAMNTTYCYALISLELAESEILAAPADTHPRTSFISFCTVQLWTLCAARSLATFCLYASGPDPGELSGFWGSIGLRHAPSLATTATTTKITCLCVI